jgi:hypothetical protein
MDGRSGPAALAILAVLGAWTGCDGHKPPGGGGGAGPGPAAGGGDRFVLFATTEIEGTIEPCGCNSDPMGDISRYVKVVQDARASGEPVLVVDAGSLLYSHPSVAPAAMPQAQATADLLVKLFGPDTLAAQAIGLGPYDMAGGPDRVLPARQAVNAGGGVRLAQPVVVDAGKVKVGVFGVVPKTMAGATDPVAAATAAAAGLRKQGAQVVVALANLTKMDAVAVARKVPGIDFMVVGAEAPEPPKVRDEPQQVGQTWLVQPANRGQVVSRIDVTVRPGGTGAGFADAIGPGRIAALDRKIAGLKADLATWQKDPHADQAFVTANQQDLAQLESQRAELARSPLVVPAQGSYFTLTQVRLRRALACDPAVVAAKRARDEAVGQMNVKLAAAMPPPAPEPGKPRYVGMEECASCHAKEVAFWKTTVHSHAWEVLEKAGKQFDYDCTSCHVTGWQEPGGSDMGHNDPLRNVQCEVCHGPGSIHVDKDGKDQPRTITRTPQPSRCQACHTPEHSDTFQFDAYLRDVTGPGHGEAEHTRLGDGMTGHALRSAALDKAGREVGAGCPR